MATTFSAKPGPEKSIGSIGCLESVIAPCNHLAAIADGTVRPDMTRTCASADSDPVPFVKIGGMILASLDIVRLLLAVPEPPPVDRAHWAVSGSALLLSPYPGLRSPVVASTLGAQIALSGPNDPRLAAFVSRYAGGGQGGERGGECTGGTGSPL